VGVQFENVTAGVRFCQLRKYLPDPDLTGQILTSLIYFMPSGFRFFELLIAKASRFRDLEAFNLLVTVSAYLFINIVWVEECALSLQTSL
jgi:hypothetical protein